MTSRVGQNTVTATFTTPLRVGDLYLLTYERGELDRGPMYAQCRRVRLITEDTFEVVKGGTKWTVIIHSKKGGIPGLMQWLYFQVIGKFRVGVPVMSPVIFYFRRKAREAEREAAENLYQSRDTED
ncbi:MAG: hypothetical protein IIC27_06535 [Chloroflexi bacterium]|nr:hypothetical protein [Chloroflexota bacterium]